MKNRDKILLGIVGAALAGVAIGLLYYTEEGKKARRKIKNTASEWADSLGSLYESGKESLADLSQKAITKAKSGLNKAKEKAGEFTGQADEFANKLG
ncbi:hypothetical protein PIECOFPK_02233 [Mycovorax composti]|jgi:hypothetical protein|uniref:YtxH domain-containing protein n=2 Tax=Chitinophagaceae TaxID=563835 RepID=A0ABZ2ELT6_9BACT